MPDRRRRPRPMRDWTRWCRQPRAAFEAGSFCPGPASAIERRSRTAASATTTASARQPATRPAGGRRRTRRSCRWSVCNDVDGGDIDAARGRGRTRTRLLSELDRTFFVEAGAGTGKTTMLVGRIVNLVAAGRVTMEHLAAITFTEAAAAELRDRVREGLERGSGRCRIGTPTSGRAACGRSARSTWPRSPPFTRSPRSCCGPIRSRRGCRPGFATLDEIEQGFLFERALPRRGSGETALEEPARSESSSARCCSGSARSSMRDAGRQRWRSSTICSSRQTTWTAPEPPPALPGRARVGARAARRSRPGCGTPRTGRLTRWCRPSSASSRAARRLRAGAHRRRGAGGARGARLG